jgi:ketosteroid isomerase-like protein
VESPAVSLIRESYEALNQGRFDWVADHVPPDFELVPTPGFGMSGRFVGPEGLSRFYAELAEAWETVRTDVEEVVDLGDRVVVLGRVHNRGRGSEIELDVVAAHLWTVEEGVPVRLELIGDRQEALRRGRAESSR